MNKHQRRPTKTAYYGDRRSLTKQPHSSVDVVYVFVLFLHKEDDTIFLNIF